MGARWLTDFVPLLRPHRAALAWVVAALVVDAALTVCRPWPLKVVIDRVLTAEPNPSRVPLIGHWVDEFFPSPTATLIGACACTLFVALGTGFCTYGFTRLLGDVSQRITFTLRCDLFAHLQRLSLRFHDRQRTGDLTARLTTDIQAIQDLIANSAILLISNGCLLAGMLVVMFWLNWEFALASLSMSPFLFWAIFVSTRHVKAAARQARSSEGLLASLVQETLASIRIVQGLAREEYQSERFQSQATDTQAAQHEGTRYQARIAFLVDVLAAISLVIVMALGAVKVRAGELTIGDVVVFFAYVTNLYSPMKALARASYAFNRASAAAERIVEILHEHPEVTQHSQAREAVALKGGIEFRGVAFEYEPDRIILHKLDLVIAPGEKIALVGATGVGKSTLVSLISRLYDATAGAVLIDGEDIRNYTLQSLRDQISLVLQDPLLFSGTIRDNIAFGRPGATDEEITAAARTAHADEFIRTLPDGYDTMIAERGVTLSGGQKQRIAIARAVLRDAPILILDEPTSNLDPASERMVLEALGQAARGRTTLIIGHGIEAIFDTVRIVRLSEGRVVEDQPISLAT